MSSLIAAAAMAAALSTPTASVGGLPVRAALRAAKAPAGAARAVATSPLRTLRASADSPRIAVVDTGVAPIADLASRLVAGADFVDADGTTGDPNGHGTAMASIAAGICTTCAIEPVRVLDDTGTGTTDRAAQGVRWAAASGARVINLSLTSPGADSSLTAAIENAVAGGAVVVVAAGNSGSTEPSADGYPGAAASDALTVASVNANRQLYSWSNHGAWVHLAAPGILNALSPQGTAVTTMGTSGSAAYVSGVAALLLSCNPSLTPAQVGSLLLGSATPVASIGGGQVDPRAALAAAGCKL